MSKEQRWSQASYQQTWCPLQERWLEPNAEMARRVVPEQGAAPGCSSNNSSNSLRSSQSISSVTVDCTVSAAAAVTARDRAESSDCDAEEASRGDEPSSGADLGTSPNSRRGEQKVGSALTISAYIVC